MVVKMVVHLVDLMAAHWVAYLAALLAVPRAALSVANSVALKAEP